MRIILVYCFICFFGGVAAQTHFSRLSGDWDDLTVWSTASINGAACGCVPGAGSNVLIDGHDIDIDAVTGNVTVNSIKLQTAVNGVNTLLEVDAVTLTVTTDLELEITTAGDDANFRVHNGAPIVNIGGDFIVDMDTGDDVFVIIEDNAVMTVTDDFLVDQDGGDDLDMDVDDNAEFNITDDINASLDVGGDWFLGVNMISGNSAEVNVNGDWITTHAATSANFVISIDDAFSEIRVLGNLTTTLNGASADLYTFDMNNGTFTVTGDVTVTGAAASGRTTWDLDGGVFTCDDFTTNQAGATLAEGATFFLIDATAEFNCTSFTSNYTGADDFFIHLNRTSGTSAEFNVTNDFTLNRTEGDDIEIFIDDDDSEMNIGGNMTIVSTGTTPEELFIELNNDALLNVTGNFTVTNTNGEDAATNVYRLQLTGSTDNPLMHVGGNFVWTNAINLVTNYIDLNGGILDVDGDMTVTQNAGANSVLFTMDENATLTVGGNFGLALNGGDSLTFNTGSVAGSTPTITVGGDYNVTHNNNSAGSNLIHHVYLDTEIDVGDDMTLTQTFTAAPIVTMDIRNTSDVAVIGDVNLVAPAQGELSIRLDNTTFFRIGGNFVRAAEPNDFGTVTAAQGTPTIEYMGSSAQILAEDDAGGTDVTYYHHLEVDNSFGVIPQLTVEGLAIVHGNLQMNDGVVSSNATDILEVADNATSAGASDNSYVDGYMRKTGNEVFQFPSGNGGFWAPIYLATAPGTTTDQFEARYHYASAHSAGFDSSLHDPTVVYISKVEYWRMNRTSGASVPTITLTWNTPRSGGVGDITKLRFMRWNGATWKDLSATSVTGTTVSGTLDNSVAVGSFSDTNPYTLGTTSSINPLPIELVEFTAELNFNQVDLSWITESELGNALFTVERSADGNDWDFVCSQPGAINSTSTIEYSDVDPQPLKGLSYYRLKQTDTDGEFSYSDAVPVYNGNDVTVYPNPSNSSVYITGGLETSDIEVYNSLGQKVDLEIFEMGDKLQFSVLDMAAGTYIIRFVSGQMKNLTLVVQE